MSSNQKIRRSLINHTNQNVSEQEPREFLIAVHTCSLEETRAGGVVMRIDYADDAANNTPRVYGMSYESATSAWINLLGKLGAC